MKEDRKRSQAVPKSLLAQITNMRERSEQLLKSALAQSPNDASLVASVTAIQREFSVLAATLEGMPPPPGKTRTSSLSESDADSVAFSPPQLHAKNGVDPDWRQRERMWRLCAEKVRLWDSYDAALQDYIDTVRQFAVTLDPGHSSRSRELITIVHDRRHAIERHCREHGCDLASMWTTDGQRIKQSIVNNGTHARTIRSAS